MSSPDPRGSMRGTEGCHLTVWPGRLTVWDPCTMALTKAVDSLVQERTVSVRPSRNSLVIEAS